MVKLHDFVVLQTFTAVGCASFWVKTPFFITQRFTVRPQIIVLLHFQCGSLG